MRKLIIACFIASFPIALQAQELNCTVKVIAPQVQGSNVQVYEQMQTAIFEFINNTKWTNDIFNINERIDCSILINISDRPSNDQFRGSIQIQSTRPIFNSAYNSPVININDPDLAIKYLQNTAIEFTPDIHRSNLASVLAFYCYYIIAADYDTQTLEGGTPFYTKARMVVNNAQNAVEPGWKAFEGNRNRYWLIENAQQAQFKPLRACLYNYHRAGFDKMYDDVEGSRKAVATSIELLKNVHRAKPGSYNVQMFFTAKADEIVNLFSQAQPAEKSKIFNILREIDAPNISKYNKIMKNN
jgi:hypothetical protein